MSGVVKNVYAFVNLAMAAFVLSAVAVRFVFPAVSAEGAAFWIVRTSPVSMRAFLWSKFWTGLVPVLVLAEALTIVSNEFLGAAPFLQGAGRRRHRLHDASPWSAWPRAWARSYPRFARREPDPGGGLLRRASPSWCWRSSSSWSRSALLAWPAFVYLWYRVPRPAHPPLTRQARDGRLVRGRRGAGARRHLRAR